MAFIQRTDHFALRSTRTDLYQPQPSRFSAQDFIESQHLLGNWYNGQIQFGIFPPNPAFSPAPMFSQYAALPGAEPTIPPSNDPYYVNAGSSGFSVPGPIPYGNVPPAGFRPDAVPPFEDATLRHGPKNFGVVLIKNIPYSVTKSEIFHFLGRHTPLIEPHVQGNPIHIIMERSTSKTMDCYVELKYNASAHTLARRHENAVLSGKHPKLGTRHVSVEVSSQDELLAELFPRAKKLEWCNGVPQILENEDPYSGGFTGFFTLEEMVGLVRHAEYPQRSPFSAKCLQRTFECMISTLYKFPWFTPHLFTLEARNLLFSTYMAQLFVLVEKVTERETVGLDHKLLMDFIFAGMNCPGFGERMKFQIVSTAGVWGTGINLSPLACFWPFDVVSRKVEFVDDNIVQFYLQLVEKGVEIFANQQITQPSQHPGSPFPFPEYIGFKFPSGYGPSHDPMPNKNTLFAFTEAAKKLSYDTVMAMELYLMQMLLQVGWDEWQRERGMEVMPIRTEPAQVERIDYVELTKTKLLEPKKKKLERQSDDKNHGPIDTEENVFSPSPLPATQTPYSPPQSPKGTFTPEMTGKDDQTLTRTPRQPIAHAVGSMSARHSRVIDPTSTPFQPRPRMLSDPTAFNAVRSPIAAHKLDERRSSGGVLGRFLRDLGVAPRNQGAVGSNSFTPTRTTTTTTSSISTTAIAPYHAATTTMGTTYPAPIYGRRNAAVEIKHPDGTPAAAAFVQSSEPTHHHPVRAEPATVAPSHQVVNFGPATTNTHLLPDPFGGPATRSTTITHSLLPPTITSSPTGGYHTTSRYESSTSGPAGNLNRFGSQSGQVCTIQEESEDERTDEEEPEIPAWKL